VSGLQSDAVPLRPEKVAEVACDQLEGDPNSCPFDLLDVPLRYDLYDGLES
jgi:hypothetical protein